VLRPEPVDFQGGRVLRPEGRQDRHDDVLLSPRPGRATGPLLSAVGVSLHGPAGTARDDDATLAQANPRAHGRQEERETFLAEGPFERRRHTDVVPHADPTGEFDIASRPFRPAVERLGLRETEQGRHALPLDPSLHAAVPTCCHRTAHWDCGYNTPRRRTLNYTRSATTRTTPSPLAESATPGTNTTAAIP